MIHFLKVSAAADKAFGLTPDKAFGPSAAEKAEQERSLVTVPDEWKDFEYFATQTKARTSTGVRNIELFDWQKGFAAIAVKENVVLTKSRQTGASQFLIIFALWFALTNPGSMVLIVSKSFGDAALLTRRMRRAITGLNHPSANPLSDSLSLVHLPNDSQVMFKSCSPPETTGRGVDSVDLLIVDEASWCHDLGTALGTLGPALSASATARMILISTPNGRTGVYWDKLVEGVGPEALEKELDSLRTGKGPGYKHIKPSQGMSKFIAHWSAIPRYQKEDDFLGRMQREFAISDATIEREFQLNFEESAQTIFDWAVIQESLCPPLSPDAKPKADCVYWASVDPCGIGQDYVVCLVLEQDPDCKCRVVAMYRKRSGTTDQHLAKILKLATRWGVSEIVVETNAMGQTWLELLASVKGAPATVGVATTFSSKPVMIGRLVIAFESGQLLIPDGGVIHSELLAFQQVGAKMEAAPGNHDDCVMALALVAHISGLNKNIIRFAGSMDSFDGEDIADLLAPG